MHPHHKEVMSYLGKIKTSKKAKSSAKNGTLGGRPKNAKKPRKKGMR